MLGGNGGVVVVMIVMIIMVTFEKELIVYPKQKGEKCQEKESGKF